jgi:Heterokaryon incompatibility protein (HET)
VVDDPAMRMEEVKGKKFVTLQPYVWRGTKSLQLLDSKPWKTDHPESLRARLEQLPKVVKDAITFTREVYKRFLWVNALCICQDDAPTNHDQILAMSSHYSNAAMTPVVVEGDASCELPGVNLILVLVINR